MIKRLVFLILGMFSLSAFAGPTITNVLVTATTATTATIQWTTSDPSTSGLQWGTNPSLQYSTPTIPTPVTSHVVVLSLLQAGPLYYAAAVSTDNSGTTQSAAITFSLCGSPLTPVQGTVNNYYQYGSYTLTWVPPAGASQSPTVCGQAVQTTVTGFLDGGASFNTQVADASKIVPGPGQWQVIVTDAGNLAPIIIDAYLSQVSQNVSQQLQAAAASSGLSACIVNTNTSTLYPSICGGGGPGNVSRVSNTDGTMTIAPNIGPVVASVNQAHNFTWTGTNTFTGASVLGTPASVTLTNGTGLPWAGVVASSSQIAASLNTSPSTLLATALLPEATGSTFGTIKPDGTSCTVTSGVLTCTGSGSGITALTGDVTASGSGSVAATVKGINGTIVSGLASGLYYNTTSTGVPSIATSPQVVTALNTSPSTTLAVALLPAATSSTLGAIKPDNVSCTVSAGILACTGSGGGITTLTGDVTASGSGSVAARVVGINNTIVSSLASGLYYNTTSTGVPSIATSPQIVAGLNSSPSTTLAAALLPLATNSAFGAVQPDGTSITISAGVISASGTGTGNLSGSLASTYIPVATGVHALGNSLAQDNGTTLTYTGSGGITLTGSTPGRVALASGSGSAPSLPANSAGWHAPTSGGTSYLFTPASTWTQGVMYAGAPTNGPDGTLQAAVTSYHPEWTIGATGNYSFFSGPIVIAQNTALNAAKFTKLTSTNVAGGSCSPAPTFNVFDTTANTGTSLTGSTTQQAYGVASTVSEALSIAAGDLYGIVMTNAGSCSGGVFSIYATVEEQ